MSYFHYKDLDTAIEFNFDEGLVVGKFAPITTGHINLISKAASACKHVTVAMCFDEKWLSNQCERDKQILTYKNRMIWLKTIFKDMPHITITSIDETNLPVYPNGWAGYANLIRGIYDGVIPNNTAVFSSELDYVEGYKKHLPEIYHVVVDNDRIEIPISATKVRNNIYKYWEYIPKCVQEAYTLKVCVIGTESSGKSTLIQSLANMYSTSYVSEYGKEYCINELGNDESLLSTDDYATIAFTHKYNETMAIKQANKVCFIDSNAFVTEFYHNLYEGCSNDIVSNIARNEHYDLIIYLSNETSWIDDGLRLNGDNRDETKELFESLLVQYPNQLKNLVKISGRNIRVRHLKVVKEVNNLMNNHSEN